VIDPYEKDRDPYPEKKPLSYQIRWAKGLCPIWVSRIDIRSDRSGVWSVKTQHLYYFASKEAIYEALLAQLLTDWLQPVRDIDPAGDPVEEILKYAKHKLKMSRLYPRESRLYATEIIQGAPRIKSVLTGELRDVVENLALLINHWADSGSIRAVDPYHLIFSIWAMTQHYADFEVQVKAILGERDHFEDAEQYLEDMLRRMLTV
jgi:TetR/AcrR family transcriptional regulator